MIALIGPAAAALSGASFAAPHAPAARHAPRAAVFATADDGMVGTVARTAATATSKDSLLSLLLDGLAMDSAQRAEVSETLLRVESENPTPSPAQSPLLNGVWELRYAGVPGPGLIDSPTRELALALYTTGFSAGGLISFLGKLPAPLAATASLDSTTVTIASPEAGQPRVSTLVDVSLFGSSQAVTFSSNLQPVSGVRLREDLVEALALGQRVLLPGPLSRTRQLYVTYVDEELLVVRDESGLSDVFVRKERFSGDSLGEPSFGDDDDAPGSG